MFTMSIRLPRLLFRRSLSRIIIYAALLTIVTPVTAFSEELIIGTGPEGSFSHRTARVLARLLDHDPAVTCTIYSSDDPVDVLTNVQIGLLDLALADSFILQESQIKQGPFTFLDISYDRLRLLSPLYKTSMVLLTGRRVHLDSSDYLANHRVNVGPPGTVQRRIFDTVMEKHGWSPESFSLFSELSPSFSQDRLALKEGSIEAMLYRFVYPDPELLSLQKEGIGVTGFNGTMINQLLKENSALCRQVIAVPGDKRSEQISTLCSVTFLIASSDMERGTVDTVISLLASEQKRLLSIHPSLSAIYDTTDLAIHGMPPFHRALQEM